MSTHGALTEHSRSDHPVTHDRKGREGKGREGKNVTGLIHPQVEAPKTEAPHTFRRRMCPAMNEVSSR